MDALQIETQFPRAERVQLDLLVEKYGVCQVWIDEIKEKWLLDNSTGYYYKPGGKYDQPKKKLD